MDRYWSETITSVPIQYKVPAWQQIADPDVFHGFEHYEQAHFPHAFNQG